MDTRYSKNLEHSFIANANELKKLAKLLEDRIGVLSISAECADDATREFSSLRDLLSFPNSAEKAIRRLTFHAESTDGSKIATIDLHCTLWRGISLNYEARDDVVSRLRNDTLDIIASMRPWYAMIHRVCFVSLCLCICFAIIMGVLFLDAIGVLSAPPERSLAKTSHPSAWLISLVAVLTVLAIGIKLNGWRDRIFPRAVFAIGHGLQRYQLLEKVQWVIVIGFLVSVVGGLFVSFVVRPFS